MQKHENLDHNFKDGEHSYIRSGEEETGDKARPSIFDLGKQLELQRVLRKQPALQETEMDFGIFPFVVLFCMCVYFSFKLVVF